MYYRWLGVQIWGYSDSLLLFSHQAAHQEDELICLHPLLTFPLQVIINMLKLNIMNLVPRNISFRSNIHIIQTSLSLSHNHISKKNNLKYEDWQWAVADKYVLTAITWWDVSNAQIRNPSFIIDAVTGYSYHKQHIARTKIWWQHYPKKACILVSGFTYAPFYHHKYWLTWEWTGSL